MTAVEAPRVPGAGAVPGPRPPGAGLVPPGGRTSHLWVATAVVVGVTLLAGLVTFVGILSSTSRWQSTSQIVFNSTQPNDENIARGSRYVQDRLGTWERIGASEAVERRAQELGSASGGPPFDAAGVTVTAKHPTGTEVLQVTATSDDEATVAAASATAAQAAVDVVVGSERFPGSDQSKITGRVVSGGGPVVDHGLQVARWWAVVAAVAGFMLSLLACSLLRPGRWARDLTPYTIRSRRRMVELNQAVMHEALRDLIVHGLRTPAGKITVGIAALSIAGYGLTGLAIFPLLPVLVAAVWTWKKADPRWSTAALLFSGVGVFPEKVDLVKVGPVTPTVLEVALLLALLLILRGRGIARAPRPVFSAPIIAILVAATVGAVAGLATGGEFSLMIDNYRALLVVATFFPVYFAFARRPHQLIAVLLSIAGVCSAVVLTAAVMGWSRLLVDERSSVITGQSTSAVARLSGPTLDLWAPLLILLLSALMPRRPRWLWLGLVLIGVLHQAGSFNRSTWAPLILLIVAVAAVTHGPKGLVRRAAVLGVVGAIGLTLALAGLIGGQAEAIAQRATSVVTGQAYGEDSLPDRLRENAAAYDTLERQPFVGVGVGQYYGGELPTYDSEHSRTVVDPRPYIHNQYLRIWLFMGVLGLFAYAFAGTRILAVVLSSWRRRTPGAPMVVVVGMGLACLAAQSALQTMLVDRPAIITTVSLMAALSAFATWSPWPTRPSPDRRRPTAPPRGAPTRPAPGAPRRPAVPAGTMEE